MAKRKPNLAPCDPRSGESVRPAHVAESVSTLISETVYDKVFFVEDTCKNCKVLMDTDIQTLNYGLADAIALNPLPNIAVIELPTEQEDSE